MLSRYSHVQMEAKRRALDEVAARQRAADEKRKEESKHLLYFQRILANTPVAMVRPNCPRNWELPILTRISPSMDAGGPPESPLRRRGCRRQLPAAI